MKITVADVIKAIEDNGYEPRKGGYFHYSFEGGHAVVVGGCALGQAGLNLNCEPVHIARGLNSLSDERLGNMIIKYNDNPRRKSWKSIARYAKKILKPYANETLEVSQLYNIPSRKMDA